MRRVVRSIAAVMAAAHLVMPSPAQESRAASANLSREQIRSMPVLERPNRPIHFYGNAVRRRHQRAVSGGPTLLPAPTAR